MIAPFGCLTSLPMQQTTRYLAEKRNLCDFARPFLSRMKHPLRQRLAVLGIFTALVLGSPALQAKADPEQIAVSVGRLLEEGHYTHQSLNDDVSRKFLRTYLELLDFSHLFFTQQDV